MPLQEWVSGRVFKFVHGNNLVYNTCWEDPRLDRVAMQLSSDHNVLVITSAGCNALDYALAGANHVYAVDMNPRQNALLDLKLAAARSLEYEDYFQMFGRGTIRGVDGLYASKLRPLMQAWSQRYWDRWIRFFDNPKRSFYFRGTSGAFARGMSAYIDRVAKIRPEVTEILNSKSLAEQQEIYQRVHEKLWSRWLKFAMNRDTTLSLLGVPKAQRRQIDTQYPGGIVQFIQDAMEAVFAKLPIQDNYFWRVYITGQYTANCLPEYLKPESWQALRNGLADRISMHSDSVQGFLEKNDVEIHRFVLLDHMDWLSDHFFPLLESEWQAILSRASSGTKVLWRSGGLRTDFIDNVRVEYGGSEVKLNQLLRYNQDLANELHRKDRVHTYGSFYIADLQV
jgi:S-adenosylmethionine-diacylglycerol 3-amino-3-carboxypropyl transferase